MFSNSLSSNSYAFNNETARNSSHFFLNSNVTMDHGARKVIMDLAGNSDLTNLAEWFECPQHVIKTKISEQRPVGDKLFHSLLKYSD